MHRTSMIVPADSILNSISRLDITNEGILAIQQEILLIDRHKRQHISMDGEVMQPEGSCTYCQRYLDSNEIQAGKKAISERREKIRKRAGTLNEIERTVNISGKNGSVLVPRNWLGKRVRIVLMDSEDQ